MYQLDIVKGRASNNENSQYSNKFIYSFHFLSQQAKGVLVKKTSNIKSKEKNLLNSDAVWKRKDI